MCGIAGLVEGSRLPWKGSKEIERMTGAIRHRGPDDGDHWSNPGLGIALGHRRLAILDLSPQGRQPMTSASGRFVIVFNGEVYNFQKIREDLSRLGHTFRGHSDTEVMLAAFEQWGVQSSVEKFIGMFAFALLDLIDRELYLVRDRIGKKPLYYGWNSGSFVFGSELKSITAYSGFEAQIDRAAVAQAMRYSYVPAPWSIYRDIYKLEAGTILTLKLEQCRSRPANFSPLADEIEKSPRPIRYWSISELVHKAAATPFLGDEDDAAKELEAVLKDAVKIRMISDVPLGAFLSGGIDSSLIVALMQVQSSKPIRTFSIGFREKEFDESQHARAVAKHLGTEHTELYVSAEDALGVIPLLPRMFDEPFSDSSQIPTYLVSKLCRQHVSVSLSGDGGDELFAGYERYPWANQVWSGMSYFPASLRRQIARLIDAFPLNRDTFGTRLGAKAQTLARILRTTDQHELYQALMSHWPAIVVGELEGRSRVSDQRENWPQRTDYLTQMMCLDMLSYLPDDILVKVDRSSMAVALETRAPLLDHRVVELALSFPSKLKLHSGVAKQVLRKVLYKYVPKTLVDRPKMGFAVPIARWLRHELRDWAENLLSEKKLRSQGFLQSGPIRQKWAEHLAATRNWEHYLWDVLMFQAWLEAR